MYELQSDDFWLLAWFFSCLCAKKQSWCFKNNAVTAFGDVIQS